MCALSYVTVLRSKLLESRIFLELFGCFRTKLQKAKHRKVDLAKIPYWYSRIAAKQIILRNIKLSRLKETIFEFREIFTVIKKSNFKTKILVIAESILNLFWYSVTRTLKSRK